MDPQLGRALTADQIYEQITFGDGPGPLADAARDAGLMHLAYDDRARQIGELNARMDAAWEGAAGEAARTGAHPLANKFRDAAAALEAHSRISDSHANTFSEVANQVEYVPPAPQLANQVTPTSDIDGEMQDYLAKSAHNIEVFDAYQQESASNGTAYPTEYGLLPRGMVNVEVLDEGGDEPGEEPGDEPGEGRRTNMERGTRPGDGIDALTGSRESVADRVEPGLTDRPADSGGRPPVGATYGQSFTDGGAAAAVGGGSGGTGSGGGQGSGGPGAAGGPLVGGPGGAGSGGPRGTSAPARPAFGQAAANRGGAGAGGPAGLGGRRGEDDDDYEHKRATYLEEPDPEGIFGTRELTAPPVLGED